MALAAFIKLHHNKPRTTIPKSFFMKLLYIFLGSLWTQSNSYKSISSATPETTTFDESFTPKSKLLNKTVFKKALWTTLKAMDRWSFRTLWVYCSNRWATGPLLSIVTLFITFQNKIYPKILKHVPMYNPCTTSPIKYRTIILKSRNTYRDSFFIISILLF